MDYEYIYVIVEENSEQDALLLSQYDKTNNNSICATETIKLVNKFTYQVIITQNRVFRFNLNDQQNVKELFIRCKNNPLVSLNKKVELDLNKIRVETRINKKFNI